MGKISDEKALEKYTTLITCASIIFVLLIIVILGAYVLTFILNSPPSVLSNTTNVYENCSYPVSNVINNYNVTLIAACEKCKTTTFSIEELKYLR